MRVILALVVLIVCVALVSQNDKWCQLRAYAAVLALLAAFVLHELTRIPRARSRIKVHNDVFCVDCRGASKATLSIGSELQNSYYEALFPSEPNAALMLATWSLWVMHSALFHEGVHEATEDSVLVAWLGATWRVWRTGALAGCALYSLLGDGKTSPKHCALALCVLSLLPQQRASVANISVVNLVAQSALFATLFLLSEAVERARAFRDTAKTLDTHGSTVFSAVLMAQGSAAPCKFNDLTASHFKVHTHPEHWNKTLKYLLPTQRSAWVLLAGPGLGANLGVLVAVCQLFVVWFSWRQTERWVVDSSDLENGQKRNALLRISGSPVPQDKHEETIEEPAKPRVAFSNQSSTSSHSKKSSLRQRKTPPPPKNRHGGKRHKKARRANREEQAGTSSESTTSSPVPEQMSALARATAAAKQHTALLSQMRQKSN